MTLRPNDHNDMSGWRQVSCGDADGLLDGSETVRIERVYSPSAPAFQEWWADGVPVLRDYRYPGGDCTHYAAADISLAATEVQP